MHRFLVNQPVLQRFFSPFHLIDADFSVTDDVFAQQIWGSLQTHLLIKVSMLLMVTPVFSV